VPTLSAALALGAAAGCNDTPPAPDGGAAGARVTGASAADNAASGGATSPPATPSPPAPPPALTEVRLRLGSWNLKKLGHGTGKRYDLLAQVIEASFDVVVVVEIMQVGGAHPGSDRLLTQLGETWTGAVTDAPRPRTGSGNSEFYGVLWRRGLVRMCDGWTGLRYADDNDGGPNGTGANVFVREPAYGCFAATRADGSVAFDFLAGAYHATWVGGKTSAIRAEVAHVADVLAQMTAARPGERDVWMLGDYNLVPAELARALAVTDDTEAGGGSTLRSTGARTPNLYDHLVVSDVAASPELRGKAHVLDVLDVASTPADFYRNVSDHLPIVVEVAATSDDD